MANEKRLIDANTMREDWLENGENEYVYDTNAVLASIDAQPTVDAVEVDEYKKLVERYHELRENFIDLVCSGIPNVAPYCLNRCEGCCDAYGWCMGSDKCKGFNPAEVILDCAKMDGDGNA